MNFAIFLPNFNEILSEFHEELQEIAEVLDSLTKSCGYLRWIFWIFLIPSKFQNFGEKVGKKSYFDFAGCREAESWPKKSYLCLAARSAEIF